MEAASLFCGMINERICPIYSANPIEGKESIDGSSSLSAIDERKDLSDLFGKSERVKRVDRWKPQTCFAAYIRRRTEVVITGLTRNQLGGVTCHVSSNLTVSEFENQSL